MRAKQKVATKLAVDTTDVTIGQDTKQVNFVQGCVQTQMRREDHEEIQYEKTLVLPPLCSTHIDRQSAVEISEASYMERFHRAIALVFNLPEHGHLRQDASSSKKQGTAAPGRNAGMAPPKTTWDRYLDLKFILPDMQECLAIMCALAQDAKYQKDMLIALERERADHRCRYSLFFRDLHSVKSRNQIAHNWTILPIFSVFCIWFLLNAEPYFFFLFLVFSLNADPCKILTLHAGTAPKGHCSPCRVCHCRRCRRSLSRQRLWGLLYS